MTPILARPFVLRRILLMASLMLVPLPPADAQLRNPTAPATGCAAGMRLCSGPHGAQCYSPLGGVSCHSGAVCGRGQQFCDGHFGSSCYTPSSGQTCMQGVICVAGQSLCTVSGAPHCITPSNGERCQ